MPKKLIAILMIACLSAAATLLVAQGDGNGEKAAKGEPATKASAPLTAQQEKELLEFFQTMGSDQYDRLVNMKTTSPPTFQSTAHSWYQWLQSIRHYPKDVQRACLDQQEAYTQLLRLVAQLATSRDEVQVSSLKGQLTDQVGRLYDAQTIVRGHRLTELKEQIQKLESEHEANKTHRQQNIARLTDQWVRSATQPRNGVGSTTKPANGN